MARMRKYGESKTTRIMMATVPHVTSGSGLRKFQADGFLLTRVYNLTRYLFQIYLIGLGLFKSTPTAIISHACCMVSQSRLKSHNNIS